MNLTGTEPWLTIPIAELTWEDLPANPGAALMILALRDMPYAEYLRTEHWFQARQMALERYLGQCLCGKNATEVHHTNYARKGFERPEDVIALCRECHQTWHDTWVLQAREGLR